MSPLVVIAAPRGAADVIFERWVDLSADGLIDEFAWIDLDDERVEPDAVLWVSGGRTRRRTLADIARTERVEVLRTVVVQPVDGDGHVVAEPIIDTLARRLESSFPSARAVRMRAVVLGVEVVEATDELALDGWTNMIIAPEDSGDPKAGRTRLSGTADRTVLLGVASVTVASLAGIWAASEGESPVDQIPARHVGVTRLVRSHVRVLEATRLEDALRSEIIGDENGLPLPSDGAVLAVEIDDVGLATSTAVSSFWDRHAEVLGGARRARPARSATRIGPLEAIRLFLGFLGAAIRNAPAQWRDSVVRGVAAGVASRVQGAIFGEGSDYAVVVRGVTADGLPASWEQLLAGAETVAGALAADGPRRHLVDPDHSSVWRDYAAAVRTLCDAGDRGSAVAPVSVGTRPGVVRRPADVVPDAASTFHAIPGHLAVRVEMTSVAAYDVIGVHTLRHRLRALQAEQGLALDATKTHDALRDWYLPHTASFAVGVGETIRSRFDDVSTEIAGIMHRFEQLRSDDPGAGAEARQRATARSLWITTAVGAGVALLGAVLGIAGLATASIAAVIAGAGVVGWIAGLAIVFYRGERDLFRTLTARREVVADIEILRDNLLAAVDDLRRLAHLYQQFLVWNEALGAFLARPFGDNVASGVAAEAIGGSQPAALRIGVARADAAAVEDAAAAVRGSVFRLGWLETAWSAFLEATIARLGPEARSLRQDPAGIYGLSADGPEDLLPRWARGAPQGSWGEAAQAEVWTRLSGVFNSAQSGLRDALLGAIDAGDATLEVESFFVGLDDLPAEPSPLDTFDDSSLGSSARAAGDNRIATRWMRDRSHGLSRAVVLVEFSAELRAIDFAASRVERAPSTRVAGSGPVF